MKQDLKLFDAEYRFACIVWENEPISSGELARLCEEKLGWKRTTTYTVLKKLCNRDILQNEGATVTSRVTREQVLEFESRQFLNRNFNGSLPAFIAAFIGDKKLTDKQEKVLKNLIDSFREDS